MFHILSASGPPIGSVTPTHIGQHYLNTSDNSLWQAYGTTNTSWKNLTSAQMLAVRLVAHTTSSFVMDVNSTTYIVPLNVLRTDVDFDLIGWTHFAINVRGLSNAASETVTLQLVEYSSPTVPLSSAGDDIVIPNTQDFYLSGWKAFASALTGVKALAIAAKGSNTTVDLTTTYIDLFLRKDA